MENDYQKETDALKDLIKQVDKVGESAWRAGEKLSSIRDSESYKSAYGSFDTYCRKEFNITAQTANIYIRIFKTYKLDEVKGVFISHLKTIMDLVTDPLKRQAIMKVLPTFTGNINNEDLVAIASIIETTDYELGNKGIDEGGKGIENDVRKLLSEDDVEKQLRSENARQLIRFGKPMSSEFIPSIRLEKEPINEMGVVGLFCLIFPYFKSYFVLGTVEMVFKKIKYIQQPFPDACVICEINDRKSTETEVLIEFEFESYEYIKHKHHLAKSDCDMIVCWSDNAKSHPTRKKRKLVVDMPPVFELKKFLKTGIVSFTV